MSLHVLERPSCILVNCCKKNMSSEPLPQNKCVEVTAGLSGCWAKKDERPVEQMQTQPAARAWSPGQPCQVAIHPTALEREDKCCFKPPSFGVLLYGIIWVIINTTPILL